MPESFPKLREFLQQCVSADALQIFHHLGDGKLWRCSNETVDVIHFSDFAFDNGEALFFCNIHNDLIQTIADLLRKDLSPVLYAPDDVIVDVIYACSCVDVFILHTYSINKYVGIINVYKENTKYI